MSRFRPRWLASWAAVNAPTPASVAWHRESWPAIPVMSVIDNRTIEIVIPLLKTVAQGPGIHVSIDTQKTAKTIHHNGRMILSIVGARAAAAMGGGGGSIVASGSRLESRFAHPREYQKSSHDDHERNRGDHRGVPEAIGRDVP